MTFTIDGWAVIVGKRWKWQVGFTPDIEAYRVRAVTDHAVVIENEQTGRLMWGGHKDFRAATSDEIRAAIVRDCPFKDGDFCELLPSLEVPYCPIGTDYPPFPYEGTIRRSIREDGAPTIVFTDYPRAHFLASKAPRYLRKISPTEMPANESGTRHMTDHYSEQRDALEASLAPANDVLPVGGGKAAVKEQCGNCRFWSSNRCKRRAPVVFIEAINPETGKHYTGSTWPDAYEKDWCGEHEYATQG